MSTLSQYTANQILNRVAAETGLNPVSDAFGSVEEHFVQMRYLLNVTGEELALAYPWGSLNKSHAFTTDGSGEYDVPDNYHYMLNQTGWESQSNAPLAGPLSPQEWTYATEGMDTPIRVMFRIKDGKMAVAHDKGGVDISYEYQSRNWVASQSSVGLFLDEAETGSDIPLFDRTLFTRYLKVKWLDAKGFDSAKAQDDFNQMFDFLTGKDKGAKILDAGGRRRGIRLLNGCNVPDTGFGL